MTGQSTRCDARPFLLAAPPPLTLVGIRDDLVRQSAQRAAEVKGYTVHAELDHTVTPSRHHELAELLAGYQPKISVDTLGGTNLQFAVTGQDIWQSVLAAMVALTNARCAPTALRIAIDEEAPSGRGRRGRRTRP